MFEIAKRIAKFIGFWSSGRWSRMLGRLYEYNAYLTTLQCLILFAQNTFIYKDIYEGMDLLNFLLPFILITIKMRFCKSERTENLVRDCISSADDLGEKYRVAGKWEIKFYRLLNISIVTLTPIVVTCHILWNTFLLVNEQTHLMCWYPIDVVKNEAIVFGVEAVRLVMMGNLNIATQTILTTIMADSIVKLKVLQYKLRNFHQLDTSNEDVVYDRLRTLAKEHQDIIRYVTNLNKALKYILFVEYNISSIMIACFLAQILQGRNLPFNITAALGSILQLLIISWNANEIIVQSVKIGDSAYEGIWYSNGKKIRQAVQLIMVRSRRPLVLTIGPFGTFTIETGIDVLKATYTFISIMSGTHA